MMSLLLSGLIVIQFVRVSTSLNTNRDFKDRYYLKLLIRASITADTRYKNMSLIRNPGLDVGVLAVPAVASRR